MYDPDKNVCKICYPLRDDVSIIFVHASAESLADHVVCKHFPRTNGKRRGRRMCFCGKVIDCWATKKCKRQVAEHVKTCPAFQQEVRRQQVLAKLID